MYIHKLENLLLEQPISYYWIGFLLADGHFNIKYGSIKLGIISKDKNHLFEFLNFISSTKTTLYNYKNKDLVELIVCGKKTVLDICKKFNIKNNKTYKPPNIKVFKKMSDDLFISLLIGFIDGDGCIFKRKESEMARIAIKNHSSWLRILDYFINRLSKITFTNDEYSKAKLTSDKYAIILFIKSNLVKFLKNKCLELNLPVLKRKWDIIDLNHFNKREIAAKAYFMHQNKVCKSEICNVLNIKIKTLNSIIERFRTPLNYGK